MPREHQVEAEPSGIEGLDELLGGGFPTGRMTLVQGGPGSGKTTLALQSLVRQASDGQACVFVTFEEDPRDLLANAATFDWAPSRATRRALRFVDGRPLRRAVLAGDFDLEGLLARVHLEVTAVGATRAAFDGLDVALALLSDEAHVRREMYRIADWIGEHRLTTLVTAHAASPHPGAGERYEFLQYLADCLVTLDQHVVDRLASRSIRVVKRRGGGHAQHEVPILISREGVIVGRTDLGEPQAPADDGRVSSGVPQLDEMLGGGYIRGSATLISGAPGSAKSTLAGAFAEAAAARGEATLIVGLDEPTSQLVRNLESVGIRLDRHVRSGKLRLVSMQARTASPDEYVLTIRRLLEKERIRCLVVDPISAFGAWSSEGVVTDALLRLLHHARRLGVTVVATSLLSGLDPTVEATAAGISTVADTWLALSYVRQGGERNRAITIIKARGTKHSHQVRELELTSEGIRIAPVYAAGGEVLFGTLRWEKELEEAQQAADAERERTIVVANQEKEVAESQARLLAAERALEAAQRMLERARERSVLAQDRKDERAAGLRDRRRVGEQPAAPARGAKSADGPAAPRASRPGRRARRRR